MNSKLPNDIGDFACNGCGACCRKFWLPLSPEELIQAFRNKQDVSTQLRMSSEPGVFHHNLYQDIEVVAPMVRFIGKLPEGRKGYYYTCVHYNKKTGKCDIHCIRPRMCRAFPFYGNKIPGVDFKMYPKCQFKWLAEKAKKEREKREAAWKEKMKHTGRERKSHEKTSTR